MNQTTNFYFKKSLKTILFMSFLQASLCINSLNELNNVIDGPSFYHNTKVGFISQGNFHAVENELSKNVEAVIFSDLGELEMAIDEQEVIAGLISGTPNYGKYDVFGSEQISVRGMFVEENNEDLLDAIDKVLVKIIESGGVEEIARQNAPYKPLIAHSCKPSSERPLTD